MSRLEFGSGAVVMRYEHPRLEWIDETRVALALAALALEQRQSARGYLQTQHQAQQQERTSWQRKIPLLTAQEVLQYEEARQERTMGFEREIRSSLAGQPQEPLFWFYVSFVSKGPDGTWSGSGGGDFMGAAVVQATHRAKVVDRLFEPPKLIPEGAKIGTSIEIPKDKLPAEQFRNRLLTRTEVETLWPGVKA